jgi:serine phosphatase RsbU (regulator of sigma subunit)
MRLSLAGHPPPVLAAPDLPARLLDIPPDPPVGFGLNTSHRGTATVELPPGALLAFYTDGLVERRGQVLDDGLAQLCGAISIESAAAVCANVMAVMIGIRPPQDDIALLVVRRTSPHT